MKIPQSTRRLLLAGATLVAAALAALELHGDDAMIGTAAAESAPPAPAAGAVRPSTRAPPRRAATRRPHSPSRSSARSTPTPRVGVAIPSVR